MKFTISEKLKFAKMHVNNLVSLFEISEKYGIKVVGETHENVN